MMPRLGATYPIEIEVTSKPKADYQTDDYFEMVGDEIVVEGSGISGDELEAAICRHLGMPAPTARKKGVLSKLFGGRD